MAEFAVWAPTRHQMDVVIEGDVIPMEETGRGWWLAEVAGTSSGVDYLFRIDGGQSFPDPRSRHQPEGVHGPSRLIDPAEFSWTDERFQARPLSSALVYELHIGTFTPEGTFDSAIDKLPHLVELGVTHVDLMPLAQFAGQRGWGYDGVYPYAPHHSYGGPAGLQRLVDACHAENLAVILDVVYNHLGPSGNYLAHFAPYYFSDRHKTPWGSAINFDGPYSDDVREYFIDNAKMWMRDYHIDGLRLDAIHAIVDTSAFPFLEQLSEEIDSLEASLGKHLVLIAESDLNDPRVVRPRERDGFGFDAQWNDDFHHALHAALTRESQGYYGDFGSIEDLAAVYRRPYLFTGRFSPFRLRSHGRRVDDLNASRFLAYSQNHDQVGNRATGERLHQLLPVDQARIAAGLTILSPYVPMLFQGQEWAASTPFQYFVDFSEDAELAKAVSQGRRKEFAGFMEGADVPDPQDEETFSRSKLQWKDLDRTEHIEMLAWYKELVALRRSLPALVDGRLDRVKARYNEAEMWIAIVRSGVVLAANLGSQACEIDLPAAKSLRIALASNPGAQLGHDSLRLPPHSMAVVCCNVAKAAAVSSRSNRARAREKV